MAILTQSLLQKLPHFTEPVSLLFMCKPTGKGYLMVSRTNTNLARHQIIGVIRHWQTTERPPQAVRYLCLEWEAARAFHNWEVYVAPANCLMNEFPPVELINTPTGRPSEGITARGPKPLTALRTYCGANKSQKVPVLQTSLDNWADKLDPRTTISVERFPAVTGYPAGPKSFGAWLMQHPWFPVVLCRALEVDNNQNPRPEVTQQVFYTWAHLHKQPKGPLPRDLLDIWDVPDVPGAQRFKYRGAAWRRTRGASKF